jgi:hypothetical protein|tara:strand:+ start:13269 stop:13484 length:216 start_codon:yes stop_codon:yes gene_type:complete
MIHAFLLIVVLGGKTVSQDMYFRSIDDCNYFASKVSKRYGNYQSYSGVPSKHKVTSYCKPVKINPNATEVY